MKHFVTERWIDFVNAAVSAAERQDMERHLQVCETCNQTVSLWRRVRQAASAEKNYQPSSEAVRLVQAAFASSNFALKRKGAFTFAELFFDSFLQPAFEGPRSSGNLTRRLLYSADPYEIDLQIDLRPDGNTLVVTGQVVDLSQQGIAGCDVRVAISNFRGPVEQTTTDQFGEFRKEIAASGELEVLFPGLGDKPVVISLRDPLGLAARKRAHTHSKIRRRTRNHQQS